MPYTIHKIKSAGWYIGDRKMKKIELLEMLYNIAKEYRTDCAKSIIRNRHMKDLPINSCLEQKTIDAILVDFINYVGIFQGVDYGLYTKYLREENKQV